MSETVEKEPFVSIITITYNAAGEIEPTVRSVAEQSCRDFEHIIIDGASSDDTLCMAHNAARHPLRILSERDKGLYDAMNKGLRMARGRYLLFLNAGDTFHSTDTLRLYKEGSKLADGKSAEHHLRRHCCGGPRAQGDCAAASVGAGATDLRVVLPRDARVSSGVHGAPQAGA